MIRGTITVAEEICKGCELCITACPQESIGLSNRLNTTGYRVAELRRDNCTGCVNCALVCPEGAITVYRTKKPAKLATVAAAGVSS
ncbi:MAG TPA: ferredoxin family protein [Bacteroidota bacterium]